MMPLMELMSAAVRHVVVIIAILIQAEAQVEVMQLF